MPKGAFILLVSVLLMAGCTTTEGTDTPLQTETTTAETPPPPTETAPVEEENAPAGEVEETIPPDPNLLLGMEPRTVQNILGPVSLKRWEGMAQIMQFSNDHCVMDIYFYEEEPGNPFEATFIKARTRGGFDVNAGVCLTSLLPDGQWPKGFDASTHFGQ